MSMSPAPNPSFGTPPKKSKAPLIIILILAGVFGLSCLCCGPALLLPAIQAAREAARRNACMNNLRQIAMAMMMYQEANNSYPPAYVADASGQPLYSWRVLLLPFLEQTALFEQFDKDKAWDSPENVAVSETNVPAYNCPSSPGNASDALTGYVLVTGPNALFDGEKRPEMKDLVDGVSNTIMLIETRDLGIHWAEPRDLTFDEVVAAGVNGHEHDGPGSYHPGGMNVVFFDAHASFISDSIDAETFRAMLTPNGGEVIGAP